MNLSISMSLEEWNTIIESLKLTDEFPTLRQTALNKLHAATTRSYQAYVKKEQAKNEKLETGR